MAGGVGQEFQLRRTGEAATVMGVRDTLRLDKDVLRFGRHSGNDFYLDSVKYSCLISRWHAEIHRVEQDESVKYIIRDSSLNGTYINDIRLKGNYVLEEGDSLMFGHVNGKNIPPGAKATGQNHSEFTFLFEKVPNLTDDGYLEVVEESQSQDVLSPSDVNIINIIPEGGSPDIGTADPHTPPRVRSSQETPGGETGKNNGASRRLIPELPGTVVLRDISNSPKCKGKELVNLDELVEEKSPSPKIKKEQHLVTMVTVCNDGDDPIIREAVAVAESFATSDSDEDIFDLEKVGVKVTEPQGDVKTEPEDEAAGDLEAPIFRPVPPVTRVTTLEYSPTLTFPKVTATSPSTSGTRRLSMTVGQLHSAASSVPQMHSPALKMELLDPALPGPSTDPTFEMFSLNDVSGQRLAFEDPGYARTAANLKPNPGRGGKVLNKGKRLPQNAPPPSTSGRGRGKRKRGKSQSQPAKRSTGGKRVASLETEEDDDDEDDIMWHYDGDRCDSYDCTQPLSKHVSWVQCDDCDKWYHTTCAQCDYDLVKLGNAEFHCGCV